jgi:SNF2 family DNA or RNA helicase
MYAYYRLINKAYTGNLETFKGNFLDKRVKNAEERLRYSMANFLLRRTHEDRINGEPLLHMPPATQIELYCKFTPYEHALYLAVIKKFEALMERAAMDQKPVARLVLWYVQSLHSTACRLTVIA